MKATTKERQLENKNRFLALKEAFLDAFEASGGTDSLAAWAKNNPDKYYPMLVRTLLKEVKPKEKSLVDMHVSILEVNAARRGAGMKEVEE